MSRLRDTPISVRQKQVLDLLREIFDGDMEADNRNYRRIADRIGWKHHGPVKDCLFCLRAKGAVASIGSSVTMPERWVAR